MVDLGDDLIIGTDRIPWLIWIQLLVMLLLIILLYNLCTVSLGVDLPSSSYSTSVHAFEDRSSPDRSFPTAVPAIALSLRGSKTVESRSNRGDGGTSSSRRRAVRNERNVEETEIGVATGKDSTRRLSDLSYHPCQFFGLARRAFLKCLGLDNNSNNNSASSSRTRHDKEE